MQSPNICSVIHYRSQTSTSLLSRRGRKAAAGFAAFMQSGCCSSAMLLELFLQITLFKHSRDQSIGFMALGCSASGRPDVLHQRKHRPESIAVYHTNLVSKLGFGAVRLGRQGGNGPRPFQLASGALKIANHVNCLWPPPLQCTRRPKKVPRTCPTSDRLV